MVDIWEHDDPAVYEQIEAAVRTDPHSRHAQQHRPGLSALMTTMEETFISSAPPGLAGQPSRADDTPGGRSCASLSCRCPDTYAGGVWCGSLRIISQLFLSGCGVSPCSAFPARLFSAREKVPQENRR